ncbi:MAG: pyridoxamine 5'-phosphate oxidase family protein [Desulfarculus sp.]|nr:pyridoxamine 5'-phosphate oxidase family protein [Desulfarculus sp.]
MTVTLKDQILAIIGQPVLGALATVTPEGKPWTRYVVPQADPDLTIHFCTFVGSRKIAHLRANPEVHLTVGNNTLENMGQPYLQIAGRAEVSTDPAIKKKYWHDGLKAYFSGAGDPNYCVVLIRPYRIEYQTFESQAPQVWEA